MTLLAVFLRRLVFKMFSKFFCLRENFENVILVLKNTHIKDFFL